MSRADDPPRRKPLPGIVERPRAVHYEGELLGLQYELGIRVSDLLPPEPEVRTADPDDGSAGG